MCLKEVAVVPDKSCTDQIFNNCVPTATGITDHLFSASLVLKKPLTSDPVVNFWWIPFLTSSKQEELCGSLNSRTIYLQLGEHGDIVHQNQTWYNKSLLHCSVELVTCPSCSIQITVERLDLPQTCTHLSKASKTAVSNCPCGVLTIWEPSISSSHTHLCLQNNESVLTSSTRSIGISLDLVPNNWTGSLILRFAAQRNQYIVNGVVGQQGTIGSPNFPSLYPRDFGIEQILSCTSENCVISLLFTDFLISTSSIMEFYDWDGKPILLVSGLISRPKPVMSTGPSLIIRFFGNGGTSMGYKANYMFFQNSSHIANINTDCGGDVDNVGGTIFMTGLSGFYDCIWIIQPTSGISHFKTHIYLKVIEYSQGILSLHNGLTSESRLIETFSEHHTNYLEHVTPIAKGFYIAFKGNIVPESKLVIAYAAFAYMDCLVGIDLLCGNKRCISIQLMCDSFDNCGDNSDENENCKSDNPIKIPSQYWWPMRGGAGTPGSGPGGALLALGAALTGAALMLAATLCRVVLRVRSPPSSHAPHHMDHVRTIAHLLSIGDLDDRDEPPMYEPPPEYNQVVKAARPRRKHSTQRLIEREPSTQSHCIDDSSLPCSSQVDRKKQLVKVETKQISEILHDTLLRIPDPSPPMSLETTGYGEDLGLSLTLSTSSQKGVKNENLRWLTTTSNKFISEVTIPSNISALSFDTLYSAAGQDFTSIPPRLTKSHSQDNILWSRSEFSSDAQPSSYLSFNNTCADKSASRIERRKRCISSQASLEGLEYSLGDYHNFSASNKPIECFNSQLSNGNNFLNQE